MLRSRWSRAVAAVALGSGAMLFATSAPASANTNFNENCESSEACVWDWDFHEGPLWDYEGTDTNFSNNYYPNGGPRLNDSGEGFENLGTSCVAVFGQNAGGASASGWKMRLAARGGQYSSAAWANAASSLYWDC
ncbi:hypothetical protein AB0J83_28610 [Actinoplanes sp. NPDC049596]|uniref:hypothetical protein n=1 Tax=unclassified Actinoplanes TaxID=2626549 RepID=UPI00341C228A